MRRLITMFCLAGIAVASAAMPALSAEFKLEKYFAGRTVAKGEFSAINGVHRTFDVVLTGRWNGKRLKLREDFLYNDGERDRKTWTFVKTGEGMYSGTREDVLGEAKIVIKGDTARYSYDVFLNSKERKNLVRFHDKMVLKGNKVFNTAYVTKFGLPVASGKVDFSR